MKKNGIYGLLGALCLSAGVFLSFLSPLFVRASTEDWIIEGDYTLAEDTSYHGNMVIKNGTLDLDGHTLTISGDLIQGEISSDLSPRIIIAPKEAIIVQGDVRHYGGVLEVSGSLSIHGSYHQDYPDKVEYTTGILKMNDPSSTMSIGKDAIFHSQATASSQSAGTLYIGGDLKVSGGGSCFHPWNTHVTVFTGKGIHTVYFASSALSALHRVAAASSEVSLLLTGQTAGFTLASDLTLAEESVLAGSKILNLNGYSLSVKGDFYQGAFLEEDAPRINVAAGETFTIEGDYYHFAGVLDAEGTVIIKGSYYQKASNREELTKGILEMDKDSSQVKIWGDAVFHSTETATCQTAGTLSIGRDLTVTGEGACFQPRNTHVTEFFQEAFHTICFESSEVNCLNRVCLTSGGSLYLTGETTGFTLASHVTLTDGSILSGNRPLNLGGFSLTVKGDFTQGQFQKEDAPKIHVANGETLTILGNMYHFGGILDIEGKALIYGNYHQNKPSRGEASQAVLEMDKTSSLMEVCADAFFHSSVKASFQNAGTLSIGGNLTVSDAGSSFHPWNEHVTEFMNGRNHEVSYHGIDNTINTIRLGYEDVLTFTKDLPSIDRTAAGIEILPENLAAAESLTVIPGSGGTGSIRFYNEDNSITRTLIIGETRPSVRDSSAATMVKVSPAPTPSLPQQEEGPAGPEGSG